MLLSKKSGGESGGQSVRGGCRKRLRFFSTSSRMTYVRMESEERKKKKMQKEAEVARGKDSKEVQKKKKRSWKRFRTAALTTCRYLGMGVAHMNPAAYSTPDYYVDPKTWDKSFNSCYKPKVQTPSWASNMIFVGW